MRSAQAGGGQEARAIGRMRARRTGSKRTIHYTPPGVRAHRARSATRRWRLHALRSLRNTSLGVRALCSLRNTPPGVCTHYVRSVTRRLASMRTVLA